MNYLIAIFYKSNDKIQMLVKIIKKNPNDFNCN